MLISSNVYTQNKVVAIPLGGEDATPGITDFSVGEQSMGLDLVDATILSVTINAPTDGVVIANASDYFHAVSDKPSSRCVITTGTTMSFDSLIINDDISQDRRASFTGTKGFNATAGANTFNLVCDLFSGTAQVKDTSLTAMYFPS